MMDVRMIVLLAAFATVLGCGPAGRYTQTGPRYAPKAENCPVQVFTALPSPDYAEIGVIDVTQFPPNDVQRFKKVATPHVCKAGGDAVIAFANGAGFYIKGTVLKQVDRRTPPHAVPQPPPPVVVAPAVPGESGGPGGCQYDTQCKGDRVCSDGQCVDPARPAPTAPTASP